MKAWVCSGLILALAAQPCLALTATATALSATSASVPASPAVYTLQALPERPAPIRHVPNQAGEDLVAITLISLPFTALWSLLGAAIVGGISQNRFPPNFDTPMLTGAAGVALGTSLAIGLVSVQWGGSHPPQPGSEPSPVPLPVTTPVGPQL